MEEDNIAKHLANNLQREEFKNRDLASIDRIIELYYTKYNNNASEEKKVISFLFSYLKEKKEPASILFRHIKNSPERYNIVTRLYHEHRYDFNFDVISSSVFLSAFDLIKINEKLKKILYFFSIFIPLLLIISITSYFRANSLKIEFEKQLKEKDIEMQKEITSKEKLENEIKIIQEKYEKDKKTKDQLGIEISTLKQNLKKEIITIKEKLENEIKTVKETTELSKCKELLQLELMNNTQIQSELITCKENLQQVELTACKQINDELLIYKEKCDI